jgi:hypothetical protein
VILQIDVTVTNPDGTVSSGSVAVDVVTPPAAASLTAAEISRRTDANAAMRGRIQARRWEAGRA